MRITQIVLSISLFCISLPALAVVHELKKPVSVHASRTACVHFKLEGVSVADPATSISEWFGIAKSHPNFNELVAILLTAKGSGRTVTVHTEITNACGYASVALLSID